MFRVSVSSFVLPACTAYRVL